MSVWGFAVGLGCGLALGCAILLWTLLEEEGGWRGEWRLAVRRVWKRIRP